MLGAAMGLLGTSLISVSLISTFLFGNSSDAQADCADDSGCGETVQYTIQRLPSPTASPTTPPAVLSRAVATVTATATLIPLTGSQPATSTRPAASPTPVDDPATATPVVSPTFTATVRHSPTPTLTATPGSSSTVSAQATLTPTLTMTATGAQTDTTAGSEAEAITQANVEPYTSTNQVSPPPAANPTPTPEPTPAPTCPPTSAAHFDLIPIEGAPTRDHPDAVHGDLNLALRGHIPTSAPLEQVFYNGSTDPNAPRLHGLFEPNRQAEITSVFKVNDWNWEPSACGGHPRGCPAPPSEDIYWPVTMVGLAAAPGEAIHIPERGPEIYPGGYIAMVLYAEETRITLGYTRRDTVSAGYTVHLENLCVDSNLVAMYRAQMDAAGWHETGHLPALRNNQAIGAALDTEIHVAIRDVGTFMDPRSHKDWWR